MGTIGMGGDYARAEAGGNQKREYSKSHMFEPAEFPRRVGDTCFHDFTFII
jgi:hypothetical protein